MATVDTRPGITLDPHAPVSHAGMSPLTGLGPGLLAGALMLVVLLILSAGRGAGLGAPLYIFASTVMGPRAMDGGAGPVVLGLAIHFFVAAVLGMAYVAIVGRTTMRRMLGVGVLYGMFVWALVQFVVLPIVNPFAAVQLGTVWPFFLGHVAYGLMLASLLPTVRDIDAPPRSYIDPQHREVHP